MTTTPVARLIGRGWSFPLRVDTRGGIGLTTERDELQAAIAMILSTAPGERLMRPDFGCEIWNLLFHPVNANTVGLMEQSVREAIARWEPRVDIEEITTHPTGGDDGRVNIEVRYVVKATNDRQSLVYPFYVIPREEEP